VNAVLILVMAGLVPAIHVMQPEAFRRWFPVSMILLGIYPAGSALYALCVGGMSRFRGA
jgi:hypothetical protein